MKTNLTAIFCLVCVLSLVQFTWAGGPVVKQSDESLCETVLGIVFAPCNLLINCLGACIPDFSGQPQCLPAPKPAKKISKVRTDNSSLTDQPKTLKNSSNGSVPAAQYSPVPTNKPENPQRVKSDAAPTVPSTSRKDVLVKDPLPEIGRKNPESAKVQKNTQSPKTVHDPVASEPTKSVTVNRGTPAITPASSKQKQAVVETKSSTVADQAKLKDSSTRGGKSTPSTSKGKVPYKTPCGPVFQGYYPYGYCR
jgi:hypothetical protein